MTLQLPMVDCLGMAVTGRQGWASSRGPCPWGLPPNSANTRATGCRGIIHNPAISLTRCLIRMKNPEPWRQLLHCIPSKSQLPPKLVWRPRAKQSQVLTSLLPGAPASTSNQGTRSACRPSFAFVARHQSFFALPAMPTHCQRAMS